MTDKEIIQALECCIKPTSDCDNCPLDVRDDDNCFDRAKQGALNIINRQQEQLDNYSHNVRNMAKDFIEQQKIIYRQQAEIEKLTINMNAFGLGMKREKERADTIRAEAIKEYMKILEEKFSQNTDISNVGYQSIIFDMEQGYKEMVGEQE